MKISDILSDTFVLCPTPADLAPKQTSTFLLFTSTCSPFFHLRLRWPHANISMEPLVRAHLSTYPSASETKRAQVLIPNLTPPPIYNPSVTLTSHLTTFLWLLKLYSCPKPVPPVLLNDPMISHFYSLKPHQRSLASVLFRFIRWTHKTDLSTLYSVQSPFTDL